MTAPGVAARRGGFSLLEVVLASALLVLLLTAAAGLIGSAGRAEESGGAAAERDGAARLALGLLRAELGLAGSDPDGTGAWAGLPPIEVGPAAAGFGDRIVVRYVDPVAGPVEAAWEAGRDGAGRSNLYRSEPGATRQPAVQGVTRLQVRELEPLLRLELGLLGGGQRRLIAPLPARDGTL